MNQAIETFKAQIEEMKIGRRGFISIPAFIKKFGSNREELVKLAIEAGFKVDKHGRYGYCVF